MMIRLHCQTLNQFGSVRLFAPWHVSNLVSSLISYLDFFGVSYGCNRLFRDKIWSTRNGFDEYEHQLYWCVVSSCQYLPMFFSGITLLQNAYNYTPVDKVLPSQKTRCSIILVVFDFMVNIYNVSFFPSAIYQMLSNANIEGVSSSRNSMSEDAHTIPFLCGSMERSSQLFVICYEVKERWVQRSEESWQRQPFCSIVQRTC
jgi:hypothetical protein